MKYTTKIPQEDRERSKILSSSGWKKLKEPGNIALATIYSLPIMAMIGLLTYSLCRLFYDKPLLEGLIDQNSILFAIRLEYILYVFVLLIIHEVLHLIFIPNVTKSKETYIGISWFGGFVFTNDEIKKSRYILITLAPFFMISVISVLLLGIAGWLKEGIIFLLLLNAIGSGVDVLNALLILLQIPKGAVITQNGEATFYKVKLHSDRVLPPTE